VSSASSELGNNNDKQTRSMENRELMTGEITQGNQGLPGKILTQQQGLK
jgi:hypothetical protein